MGSGLCKFVEDRAVHYGLATTFVPSIVFCCWRRFSTGRQPIISDCSGLSFRSYISSSTYRPCTRMSPKASIISFRISLRRSLLWPGSPAAAFFRLCRTRRALVRGRQAKCGRDWLAQSKGHKFNVTAKGRVRSATLVQWSLLTPFLVYIAFTIAGILWAFVIDDSRPLAGISSGIALLWSWYNIVILVLACIVAIEASDRRISDRVRVGRRALLKLHARERPYLVSDISVTGMKLSGALPGPIGSPVHIQLDNLDVDATIVRGDRTSFAVKFAEAPKTRAKLIRHVYGGSYIAAVHRVRPLDLASAIIGRVFR